MQSVLWGTLALAWPLVLSMLARSVTATLIFYGLALVVDVVLFAVWLIRALRYSKAASLGATFALRRAPAAATRGIPAKH